MDKTRVSACTTIHFQPSDNFIVLATVTGKISWNHADYQISAPSCPSRISERKRSRVGSVDDGGGANAGAPRRARVRRVLRKFARHGIWRSVCAGRTSAGLAADAGPRQHTAQPLRLAAGRALSLSTALPPAPITRGRSDTGLPDRTAQCPGGYHSRHIGGSMGPDPVVVLLRKRRKPDVRHGDM